MLSDEDCQMGFADYCISQLKSCDPKFRQDVVYIFFILLVKELIELKRCKQTFLSRLQGLSKSDIIKMDPLDLNQYNRTYEVFKNMRGTAIYYEKSKKNVLSMLRQ